jgi:hypothetical protein
MKQGYYQTKNSDIPYNDREPGELASIAQRQLAAYQAKAEEWPLNEIWRADIRDDIMRHCMVCCQCYQNIYFISDDEGRVYDYTEDELKTLVVAHLRQSHPEVVDVSRIE